MVTAPVRIRHATAADAGAVAGLAEGLAQSFTFSRASFDAHYPALLAADHACLLVAVTGTATSADAHADAAKDDCVGYMLGFDHLTFYANGRVAWAEEVFVRGDLRGLGVGRALMTAFETVGARPRLRARGARDQAGSAVLPRARVPGLGRLPAQAAARAGLTRGPHSGVRSTFRGCEPST